MLDIEFEFVERIKEDCFNDNGIFKNSCGMLKLPKRNTKAAAGYDFVYLDEKPTIIKPNEIVYVKTGIKATFPDFIQLKLYNRSSNPKKKGLVLANGVGIVDADYYNNPDNEGEIAFAFMNISTEDITIQYGEKLGQGIFEKYYTITDEEEITSERTGGFGSTGK